MMSFEKKYTPVKYLESTGSQYIDTGYKPNQNTKIEFDGNITMGSAGRSIFGSNPYFVVTSRRKTRNYVFRYNDTLGETDFQVSTRCNIMLDKTGGYINNNLYQSWDDVEFQSPYNILLFARNSSSGSAEEESQSRIYSCKIYESGVLVRDYIPVIDSSNRPCLYDKVEDKFYYNEGSGEFLYE